MPGADLLRTLGASEPDEQLQGDVDPGRFTSGGQCVPVGDEHVVRTHADGRAKATS